ncbi:MAG: hypothetical protein WD738_15105 [Pirellulales bacterium]
MSTTHVLCHKRRSDEMTQNAAFFETRRHETCRLWRAERQSELTWPIGSQ